MPHDEFLRDNVLQKAACFDILCLSEATARLIELDSGVLTRHPDIPWRQIADIGNVLRHEYGRIDMTIIWETVTSGQVETLLAAVLREVDEPETTP